MTRANHATGPETGCCWSSRNAPVVRRTRQRFRGTARVPTAKPTWPGPDARPSRGARPDGRGWVIVGRSSCRPADLRRDPALGVRWANHEAGRLRRGGNPSRRPGGRGAGWWDLRSVYWSVTTACPQPEHIATLHRAASGLSERVRRTEGYPLNEDSSSWAARMREGRRHGHRLIEPRARPASGRHGEPPPGCAARKRDDGAPRSPGRPVEPDPPQGPWAASTP